jgi:hypothetical protein
VVAVWALYYVIVVTTAPLSYDPVAESADKVNREFALLLVVPTALWVAAALLLVHHWWSRNGVHLAATDPPGRLLAAAVATLPDHRREWGAAMTAELAGVQGRPARWRFALSTARAALWTPRPSGWPVLALVIGVVATSVAAVGQVFSAAVPGLDVFAVSFVGLVGALVVLAAARSCRLRLPVPAPTLLVTGGVAAAITLTVLFLRRDPTAATYLSPAGAVFLAVILAGCLWIAVGTPRSLGTSRLAPHVGAGTALVYVVGLLLLMRAVYDPRIEAGIGDPAAVPAGQQVGNLAFSWLVFGLAIACFVAALVVGLIDRSFRSGLQAGIWVGIAILPLAYAVWLHEALRLYPVNGGLLFYGDGAPEGENLGAALTWVLGIPPALGLPFAAIGAALGMRITGRTVTRARADSTTANL